MYTIYVDGNLLFSSAACDEEHIILSPRLSLDVSSAGSLTFVLPPGNALYNSIHRLKSIITVKQDDEIIFRGRVLDDEKDFYNQKDVYCEGDRSFLLDSLCAPYAYSGTALGLFQKLINEHNAQVDSEKQFAIGRVTAVSSSETLEVENVAYYETLKEFEEKLLDVYGGYLMTRTEGGVTYVDWLLKSGDTSSQVIEFSVNLLDIKDKVDASDVFTVLIPLGASNLGEDGEYSEPVNIASVNNGLKYIQDDEAVARYGKIWRTKTWNYEEDPAKLKAKGLEYMKTGIALQTLTLQAIDMHFINGSAKAIRNGSYVRILSNPHGLDITMNCTKMDIDLLNPENTPYTFGEPPRTLTENVVKAEEDLGDLTGSGVGGRGGGGGRSVKEELKDYIRWADIRADADEALIELTAGEVRKNGERLSRAEITLDGLNAQILLKADVSTVNELENRMTSAEIEIDGANAQILLKANATTVDALGKRVSSAEIEIDGLNSEITLKADKVTIDAELTTIKKYFAGSATAAKMVVTNMTAVSLTVGGNKCAWKSKEVVTGVSVSDHKSGAMVRLADGDSYYLEYVSSVSRSVDTDTIYYMSWA